MKKTFVKIISMLLLVTMMLSLTACGNNGGSNTAGSDTSYTMWIYSGADFAYYSDYAENPVFQYTKGMGWGEEGKAIDIEFWVPPAGTQNDNYATMIGSGDLPDIIDGCISDPAPAMYEEGIIIELTEYIDQYMPNYKSWLEKYPAVAKSITFNVDGKDRIFSIIGFNEDVPYQFQGTQYRRDWIVKYGTNPTTGAAFTGGYEDPNDVDSWKDDVVFPSGGTDPVYISDWEWMFEIFAKALEAEGITDGYATSIYYPGFTWNGGLCSCFGGGTVMWSADPETDECRFGGDSSHMRAYLTCLNNWYEKGWLDKHFNERTADIFYDIDSVTVRQGKVGLWVGQTSQLGGRMDLNDGGYTEGIYVAGCALPINDIYGTDADKFVEPDCIFGSSISGTSYLLTTTLAESGKDIPTLLSYIDYFYSEEGALIKTMGLNAEQAAELGSGQYESWGLSNGSYHATDDGRYVWDDVIVNDTGALKGAVQFMRFPGVTLVGSVDEGYHPNYEKSLQLWLKYPNTSFFQGTAVTNNMTVEDTTTISNSQSRILDFMTINAPDFIKGKKDIENDEDWNYWCTMLKKYNYQKVSDICQKYLDLYDFA